MKTIELEEIRMERKAIEHRLCSINEREREIYLKIRDAERINADETLLKEDIDVSEVNYILGQSDGYVQGFKSAINVIVAGLVNEDRDIPITEDELYLICELGEIKERAWLKDMKQKEIANKNGWDQQVSKRVPIWEKKQTDNDKTEE